MWVRSLPTTMAPNLKGRPRKKKPCSQRRESHVLNGTKEPISTSEGKVVAKVKCEPKQTLAKSKNNNSNCKKVTAEDNSKAGEAEECGADEQAFLVALYKYMKERKTPIERIPYLGFKQINLWTMFQAAQNLGGYDTITARRQWKNIYDELGGNPGSTSAATCTRRHYERLILPYERFIKGEEDKPLPPVKPRKQENNSQEGESKMKLSGTKRNKNENHKGKKEKENVPKADDSCGVSSVKENEKDSTDQKGLVEIKTTEAENTEALVQHSSPVGLKSPKASVKVESKDIHLCNDKLIEESDQPVGPSSPVASTDDTIASGSPVMPSSTPVEDISNIKLEQQLHTTIKSESELLDSSQSEFPEAHTQPLCQSAQDQKSEEISEPITNSFNKDDLSTAEDVKGNMEKDVLEKDLNNSADILGNSLESVKEKDLTSSARDDSSLTYAPVLYSRGNPGIMSPLAKKKLLSQVSGVNISNTYPYGTPPPLISKKKSLSTVEDMNTPGVSVPHSSPTETLLVIRPSVIQHAHSFKSKHLEDKKNAGELFMHDDCKDLQPCDFSKNHFNSLADKYGTKCETQECKERSPEKRAVQPLQTHGFMADFYSSPHLHSLYRHTEHHLSNEQASKYITRDLMFREPENSHSFSQNKLQEKCSVNYCKALHQHEKRTAAESSSDDQPTDLSLPKCTQKQSIKPLPSSHPQTSVQQDGKNIPHFQSMASKTPSSDCNPKACRVTPITVAVPQKIAETNHRGSGKSHSLRPEDNSLRKIEGMVRPVVNSKSSPQNIGAARPLKRNLEDNDSVSPEKKVRAVSPLHFTKEATLKEKGSDEEAECNKASHTTHPSNHVEGHKIPATTPIFQGLYPGTFVSQVQDMCTGLGTRFPASYAHSLQYLKNQTMFSPLMQPLAIHSFMMQRQFLTSSGNSPQFYRHLTATPPVGASYGDILHNTIYPLAAINPQTSFTPSQLSSVHPSTKL
ncbi:AT-rich interactive domain-containing protein 5B isoform X2 [Protopterus annectens]|uniref:AT-rich interactive domain-containing protein 5B isoform X2 n=1 Tax=Protopterus annectens TaxID=7888 RepID=UPI001CFA2CD9|nr:AT-rich interactive domain-containing protein 5B isoform X2 [Protopterus annectens]